MRDHICECPGERLSAYIDGELDERERREVRAHLDGCRWCQREVEQLRRTREFLSNAPSYDLPPDFHRRLRAELLRKRAGVKRVVPKSLIPAGVYLAALLAFLIMLPASALYTYHAVPPEMMLAQTDEAVQTEAEYSPVPQPERRAEWSPISAPVSDLRTEELRLQVTDVRSRTEYLIETTAAEGAQVKEQEFTWGSGGDLQQATLVFQLSADEMSGIQKQLAQLGDLTLHRIEDHAADRAPEEVLVAGAARPDTDDVSGVVMKVTLFALPSPQEEGEYEMLRLSLEPEGHAAPFARQLRTSFTDSWISFGAHVSASILWAAGHLPHLFFLGALVALAFLAVSGVRRPR